MATLTLPSHLFLFLTILIASLSIEVNCQGLGGNEGHHIAGVWQPIVGGWEPIKDLNDKYIVEIAEFAVRENGADLPYMLTFDRVIEGEQHVVDEGVNYRLEILAKGEIDGDFPHGYEVVVYDKPFGKKIRKLISFKRYGYQ